MYNRVIYVFFKGFQNNMLHLNLVSHYLSKLRKETSTLVLLLFSATLFNALIIHCFSEKGRNKDINRYLTSLFCTMLQILSCLKWNKKEFSQEKLLLMFVLNQQYNTLVLSYKTTLRFLFL